MRITKYEALKRGITENNICPFHEHNPDQAAITETCPDCIYIEDECGCGIDDSCELCEIKKWIFKPTSEQQEKIDKICRKCIDNLSSLPIPQKAHALKCLVQSFEDITRSRLVEKWSE